MNLPYIFLCVLSSAAFLFLDACNPPSAGSIPSAQLPPSFEIRDFIVTETTGDSGTSEIRGRGVLVSRDEKPSAGTYIVWLSVQNGKKAESPPIILAFMRDGIATIETWDLIFASERANMKIEYSNWKILGFNHLQEGQLIGGSVESSASSAAKT